MKTHYTYAALAAALTLALSPASAQGPDRAADRAADRAEAYSRSVSYEEYLKDEDLRASKLVGARVRNAEGDVLGEIEELVIPSRNRDEILVIVSAGGAFDVGDKLVALPYDELRVSADGDTFYFDRTETQLKEAPAFDYETQAEARSTQRTPAATARTSDRPRTTEPRAATAAKSANVVLDVFDHRASDLIGATVLDDRGESVGKIDDVVVSTENDELHAVIAIGGFAGFGAKLVSMPFDDLQITSDDDNPQVRIAMTGEQLQQLVESRPEFRYERQLAQGSAATPRG